MKAKKALRTGYLNLIWVALIFVLLFWLMSVLKCDMAPPAY